MFRYPDRDVVGLADEDHPGAAPLLELAGKTDLEAARQRAAGPVGERPVVRSERLEAVRRMLEL